MKKTLAVALGLGVAWMAAAANDLEEVKAKIAAECKIRNVDRFYGHDRVVFEFQGHEAWVVCPKAESRPGKPWTWTMQWATAFVPRTNVPQMLDDGYHHATIITFDLRMTEPGLKMSADFQRFLVEKLGFAPKANLIGMSWGGFFSIRYAATYPQNVAKIYLDAPYLNFYGKNVPNVGPWEKLAPANGNWMDDPRMPINIYPPIIKAGIPVLLLYGNHDQTLDPKLNSELFIARFKRDGGKINVVKRECYGHHPHGIEVDELTIKNFFDQP